MSLVSVAVLGSPVSASHLTVKVLRLLLAFRGVLETELRLSGLCAGTCMMKPSPPLCTCFNLPHATWMQHISPSVFPGRAIFQSRAASAFLPPFHPRPCQGWCAHAHRHTHNICLGSETTQIRTLKAVFWMNDVCIYSPT